jgi:hypothetical protein
MKSTFGGMENYSITNIPSLRLTNSFCPFFHI